MYVEGAEAAFPDGARLEYRIATGDMYFDGDRSQALGTSLWVIEPDGSRKPLANDFIIYVEFNVAALNLKSTILAVIGISSSTSKRTALLSLVGTLPSYAGGYALAVVFARHLFK